MKIKSKEQLLQEIKNKEYLRLKSAGQSLDDNSVEQKAWLSGYLDACQQIYDTINNLCVEFDYT